MALKLKAQKSPDNDALSIKLIGIGNQLSQRNGVTLASLSCVQIDAAWVCAYQACEKTDKQATGNASRTSPQQTIASCRLICRHGFGKVGHLGYFILGEATPARGETY